MAVRGAGFEPAKNLGSPDWKSGSFDLARKPPYHIVSFPLYSLYQTGYLNLYLLFYRELSIIILHI